MKAFLLLLVLALTALAKPPKPPVGVAMDAVSFQGKWYRVYLERVPWNRAAERCQILGGQLASADTQEVWGFILGLTPASLWLGANDEKTEGVWMWTNGRPLEFSVWAAKEPSNTGANEHFLATSRTGWRDMPNSGVAGDFHVAGFVCEWTPPMPQAVGLPKPLPKPDASVMDITTTPNPKLESLPVTAPSVLPPKPVVPNVTDGAPEPPAPNLIPISEKEVAAPEVSKPANNPEPVAPKMAPKEGAKPAEAPEEAGAMPKGKPMPFKTSVDEIRPDGFFHKNKDGKRVFFRVTEKTVIKQGGAVAQFGDIKTGDIVNGSRIKVKADGSEYELGSITKFSQP